MEATIQRLTPHIVFLPADHATDRPLLAAVSGASKTLLIDAGNSPAHAALFRDELRRAQLPTGDCVVLTHWHWDHSFGLVALDMPGIAHWETRTQLERMSQYAWDDAALDQRVQTGVEIPFCADMIKKEYPDRGEISISLPNITFESHVYLDLGGIHCMIEHVGGNHAADSSVIYVEEDRTLFLGDCLNPAIYAEHRYYQRDALLALLDVIDLYGAEIMVESHWKPETNAVYQQGSQRLRTIARLMRRYRGDDTAFEQLLGDKLGRPLDDEDRETIGYLKHGMGV